MGSYKLNDQFLRETIFAIADGYSILNLTKNEVIDGIYQAVDGKKINLSRLKGLPKNAAFDQTIEILSPDVSESDRAEFLKFFKRETLLERFNNGETHLCLKHWTSSAVTEPIFIENHLALFLDESTGDVMAASYMIDRTTQILNEKLQNKLQEKVEKLDYEKKILDALCDDYISFYHLDFSNNRIDALKLDSETRKLIKDDVNTADLETFSRNTMHFFDMFIDRECSPDFAKLLNPTNLAHRLARERKIMCRFGTLPFVDGKRHWLELVIVRLEDKKDIKAVMGYRNIDEIVADEEAQNNQLKAMNESLTDQVHIISGLSNAYFTVHRVDLVNNTCTFIKCIDFFKEVSKDSIAIDDVAKLFLELCVSEEDREKMRAFTDHHTLSERLEHCDSIVEEFHGLISPWEWCRASWIVASRDENGKAVELLYAVEDITASTIEKKRIETERDNEYKLTELRLKTMVEAIHGGFKLGLFDEKFTVKMVSEQFAHMLGYDTPEEFMEASGGCMANIVNREDAARELPQASKDVADDRMYTMRYRVRCKNGSWKNVEDRGRLIKNSDGTEEFWSFVVDHDELVSKSEALEAEKRANEALIRTQEELKVAKNDAEIANRAKSNFLFNMSHDIRTPMNALLGYTKLMGKELTKPKLLGYQEKIEQSGNLLLSIINNVLDMARIESGKIELDENFNKVGSIVSDICNVFEVEAAKKNIKIIHSVNVTHKGISCDIIKVQEIFTNLLSNALKYTPAGGTITVTSDEIPCDKAGFIKIKTVVSDTGIGMGEDYLPHLFEPFSRERNTTVGKVAGTGLGMPIVKKLVELMGGTIEVKSELGKGSRFTVILPHRLADEEYYEKKREAVSRKDKVELFKGKHILMAEDNELNSEIAIAVLSDAGFVVDRVEDGIQCVDRMEQSPAGTYDLILMDVQMPHMDGYKATGIIRNFSDKKKASIPIVAMTANAFDEDKKAAFAAGMNGHIAKPIDIDEIEKVLLSVLN